MAKMSKAKRKSNGKATAKKSAKKMKTTTKAMATTKLPSIKEQLSKKGIIDTITTATSLGKKDVVSVLDCFSQVIEKHVKTGGPGTFVLPGMMKISVVKKPARPARKGINPFTGEEIMIKARPARKAVKIKPLKKLKEMVAA